MSVYDLDKLIMETWRLAADYQRATGAIVARCRWPSSNASAIVSGLPVKDVS